MLLPRQWISSGAERGSAVEHRVALERLEQGVSGTGPTQEDCGAACLHQSTRLTMGTPVGGGHGVAHCGYGRVPHRLAPEISAATGNIWWNSRQEAVSMVWSTLLTKTTVFGEVLTGVTRTRGTDNVTPHGRDVMPQISRSLFHCRPAYCMRRVAALDYCPDEL
jgi:hypothetical protein